MYPKLQLLKKLSQYGLNSKDWEIQFISQNKAKIINKGALKILLHGVFTSDKKTFHWKEISLVDL